MSDVKIKPLECVAQPRELVLVENDIDIAEERERKKSKRAKNAINACRYRLQTSGRVNIRPRSFSPFLYIEYTMKLDKTSWTYSIPLGGVNT